MIEIGPLRPADRDTWEVLARGYKEFYREPMPDEAYEATWRQLSERGVEFVSPPQKQPWGTFAIMKDSEDNNFVLSSE